MNLIIDVRAMYEEVPDGKIKISYILKDGNSIEPSHFLVDKDKAVCSDELMNLVKLVEHIYIFDSPETIDFLLTNSSVKKSELDLKVIDIKDIYAIRKPKGRYIRMMALNTFIEDHDCTLMWMLTYAQKIFKAEFFSYDTRYTVTAITTICDAVIPNDKVV